LIGFSTSLDTARSAKSRFIFTVAKELNETGGSGFRCDAAGYRLKTLTVRCN
jgi:hypothetical protein